MKTGKIILLLACVFIGSGCQKEEESIIPKWSKITALKDGEQWEIKGYAYMDNDGSLGIVGSDWSTSFSNMNIINLPPEIGNHAELIGWDFYYGHSGIVASYNADKSADNLFEIRNIDLGNMEIDGIFKVSFIRKFLSPSTPEERYPPLISFTTGNFRLKIMSDEDNK
jgi:hypothetical protein